MKLRLISSVVVSVIASVALPSLQAEPVLNLSEAQGYNLLTWGAATLNGSDITGSVAAGGNASFDGYSIGNGIPTPANPAAGVFVVGGNLTAGNGQVYNGSIYVGGTYSGPGYSLNSAPGSVTQSGLGAAGLPINFSAAQAALTAKSLTFGAAVANGTSQYAGSTLTLTGSDANVNVFNIDAATLAATNSLVIDVSAGSHVLINVSGASVTFGSMGISGSFDNRDTLFNFYQATTLTLTGIGVEGSILAPTADVTFTSGQMNGQLIANSFTGNGELHDNIFNDQDEPLRSVPEAASTGLLVVLGLGGAQALKRALKPSQK